MDMKFSGQLLLALDEQEVRKKIRRIVAEPEQEVIAMPGESEIFREEPPQPAVNIDLLQSTIERLKTKKEELELHIQDLKDENLKLMSKEKVLWTKSQELETSMENLRNENHQLKEIQKQLKQEKEQLTTSNQQMRSGSVNLEAENYRLKSKEQEFMTKADNLQILLRQSNEENRQLREQNDKLEQEKEQLNIAMRQLNLSNTRLEESSAKLQMREKELFDRADAQRKTIAFYESYYANIDYFYRSYNNLNLSVHEELSGVLNKENPELFLVSGMQWTNIEKLWEFIGSKFGVYEDGQMYPLIEMWEYFFNTYCKISPNYERLKVKVGEEFDENLHTLSDNSSAEKGTIAEVMLWGYRDKTEGVIKKSIVRI